MTRCLARGKRRRLKHLEVIWADNSVGHPRMGLIVPRFSQSAVARNRLRRRLREIWRRLLQRHQGPRDLIVRARREAYAAPFADLRTQLVDWADRALGSGSAEP